MRVISWIVGVPLAILVLLFAVANRAVVTVSLDPFNTEAPTALIQLPLFLLLFATLVLGVIFGGVATWVGASSRRREARRTRDEARLYRQEAERLRAEQAAEVQSVANGHATVQPLSRQLAAPSAF